MFGLAAGPAYRSMASSDSSSACESTRCRPDSSGSSGLSSTAGGVGTAGAGAGRGLGTLSGADPKSRTEPDDPPRGRPAGSWSRASRMDDRLPSADGTGSAPRATPEAEAGSTIDANGMSVPDGDGTGMADLNEMTDPGLDPGAGMAPAASDGGYRMSNLTSDSPVPVPSPTRPRSMSDSLRPLGAVYTGRSPGKI